MKVYTNLNGSEYVPYREGNSVLVRLNGQGLIHESLRGKFTSERELEVAILRTLQETTPLHNKGKLKDLTTDRRLKKIDYVDSDNTANQ